MTGTPPRDDPGPELLALVRDEARRVAMRLPADGPTEDDLVGFGHLGLLEARERYDPRRGVHFELFARHRIRGAMYDGLRALGCFSRRGYEDLRRRALAHEALGEPAGDPPGGPDRDLDARALAQAIGRVATAFLADAALSVRSHADGDPEASLGRHQALARLRRVIDGLPVADREVLEAIYDLNEEGDSGAALARRRGVSRSQVSRRHRTILDRLRRLLDPEDDP